MISRNPDALWTELEEHAIFLDSQGERYFEANAIGTFIWRLLDTPRSLDDLTDQIVARYRVEREQGRADVSRFIERLRAAGFVIDTSV